MFINAQVKEIPVSSSFTTKATTEVCLLESLARPRISHAKAKNTNKVFVQTIETSEDYGKQVLGRKSVTKKKKKRRCQRN